MESGREQEMGVNPLTTLFKLNLLILPSIKPTTIFSSLIRAALAFCLLASLSLLLFVAFSSRDAPTSWRIVAHDRLALPPFEDGTNVSHLLFGIGGSAKTWHSRRHYSDLWWRPNVTRGFVWIDEAPQEKDTWPLSSPPYVVSGDTSHFNYTCWYGSRSAIRIARIVKESFLLGLDNVRWFVMGDDDTVFFVDNLLTVLRKYDHNQMYYVGANSESVEQDVIHSYTMAYGGAGFAISYPLAAQLVNILDGCIDRYASFYGSDQKVQGCLSEIGVPITKELGFHQVDIRGSPYGVLAAHPIAPLVSLHHLDYVQPIFPGLSQQESIKKLVEASEVDPGRTLQHSFCHDLSRNWSVSVSWGYTVQLYPWLMTAKELETAVMTFQTWRTWSDGPFAFDTRPANPDPCQSPVIYFVERVKEVGSGGETVSMYKRFEEKGVKECDKPAFVPALAVEFFKVSVGSKLKPDSWKMAPRRKCCEVMSGADGGVVEVMVRECNDLESVTPP